MLETEENIIDFSSYMQVGPSCHAASSVHNTIWKKASEHTCCVYIVLKPDWCVYNLAIACVCVPDGCV